MCTQKVYIVYTCFSSRNSWKPQNFKHFWPKRGLKVGLNAISRNLFLCTGTLFKNVHILHTTHIRPVQLLAPPSVWSSPKFPNYLVFVKLETLNPEWHHGLRSRYVAPRQKPGPTTTTAAAAHATPWSALFCSYSPRHTQRRLSMPPPVTRGSYKTMFRKSDVREGVFIFVPRKGSQSMDHAMIHRLARFWWSENQTSACYI